LDQLTAEVAEIGGDFRPSQFDATGLTDEDYFTKFGMTRSAFEALPVADQRRLQGLAPELGADIKGIPRDVFDRLSPEDQQRVILGDASPGAVNGIPRDIFDRLSATEQQRVLGTAPEAPADIKGIPASVFNTLSPEDQRRVLVGDTSPGAVNGVPRDIFESLSAADQQRVLGTAPAAPADIKGIPEAVFNALSPEDQRRVLVGDTSPGAVNGVPRDIFDRLSATEQQRVLGTAPEPEGPAATLKERDRAVIINQETLDNLENLSPQQLSEFAASAATYVQEQVGPAGVSSREPLPPNTQEAMRRAHAAGVSFPGIDSTLFGAPPTADELDVLALNILDPSTDLRAATGLLSGVQRGINLFGEQLADFVGGTGTAFVNTAEGSQSLKTLAAATNRFYLAGKTLALEFSLLQEELVRPAALRTDQDAIRALTNQRALLEGDLARVQQVLNNPRGYTNADISTAREIQTYAQQLLLTYDDFIQAYGGARTGPLPTLNDIMSNPANLIQPQ
jgi:hypothetical protein